MFWRSQRPPTLPAAAPPRGRFAAETTGRLGAIDFRLLFASDKIAAELLPRLEGLCTAGPARHSLAIYEAPDGFALSSDGVAVATEPSLTGARTQLLLELTRLASADGAFSAVLHAGVCVRDDSAVILAGAGRSGKSTLCAALRRAGWLCFSDDSAALTPSFEAVAMPFALMLREGSWPLFPETTGRPVYHRWGEQVRFLPADLPSGPLPAAPVAALVFVTYQPDGPEADLSPLPTFEALLALEPSGFWVDHSPAVIESFLGWLAKLTKYQLTYSSIDRALDLLATISAAREPR